MKDKKHMWRSIITLAVLFAIALACTYYWRSQIGIDNSPISSASMPPNADSKIIAFIEDDEGRREHTFNTPFRTVIFDSGTVYKCVKEKDGFTLWSAQFDDETFAAYVAGVKKLRIASFAPSLYTPPDARNVTIGLWIDDKFLYYSWTGHNYNLPASLQASFPAAWAEAIDALVAPPNAKWRLESNDLAGQLGARIGESSR